MGSNAPKLPIQNTVLEKSNIPEQMGHTLIWVYDDKD